MSAELLIPAMLNHSSITALIGTRLALERLPTNSVMPACVYTVISDTPQPNVAYQNGQQLSRARIQINPLATTVTAVVQIHTAIRTLLDFKHRTTFSGMLVMSCRVETKGMYEKDDETGIWTRPVDYILQYYE
jgi:hypothetical protein